MLAAGGLFVAWLDAAHPPASPLAVRALLLAYLIFAIGAAIVVWRVAVPRVRGSLIRHYVDVLFLAAIMYESDGPSNPYAIFMPFILLAGTLHWRWRGTLWTSLACAFILAVLVGTDTRVILDIDADTTADASLTLFVIVTAVLLTWLGAHEDAVRADLLRLIERAPAPPKDRRWPAEASLDYVKRVMNVSRVMLLWSDGVEPWTYLAHAIGGRTEIVSMPPDKYWPWVADGLEQASVLHGGLGSGPTFIHLGDGRFEAQEGLLAVNTALLRDFRFADSISVPFRVGELEARLFLLDPRRLTLDQVVIAEVVVDRLRTLFEQTMMLRQLSDAAANEERIKIGRDLHDGILQAMAGTALQLESLRPMIKTPILLGDRLTAIQSMLADEQRDLRMFVKALEPGSMQGAGQVTPIAPYFEHLAKRLVPQWSIAFQFAIEPPDARLPARLVFELTQMASEATANAVRHGHARSVEVRIDVAANWIALHVTDDGDGFGWKQNGRPEPEAQSPPRSLQQRAQTYGGSVAIEDGPPRTRVEIRLPLEGMGA